MTGTRDGRKNTRLQWHRANRGWSRSELARQVTRSIAVEHDEDFVPSPDVTEDMVKAWETRHGTDKAYAKHLCLLFERTAQELGLLTDAELALEPPPARALGPERRSGMVDRRVGFEVQEVVTVMRGRPEARWRAALQAARVPVKPEHKEVLESYHSRCASADPKAVQAYIEIVAAQRSLYWSTAPTLLLSAARAHLDLGTTLLASDPADRPELASAVAECALLVARLAFFDLEGHDELALEAFSVAEAGVTRAQDHSLAVAVAAHQAFVPGFGRRLADARPFLVSAERQWRNSGQNPLVGAWVHCVYAEVCARGDHISESQHHLTRAQEFLAKSDDGAAPLWLDFFDSTRFAGFAGNTALLAGEFDAAIDWLQQSLDGLGTDNGKQRAVLLLDLAAAHAGDSPEHAVDLAIQACEILERDYYQTAVDRIPTVRASLSTAPAATQLYDRAHHLLHIQGPVNRS